MKYFLVKNLQTINFAHYLRHITNNLIINYYVQQLMYKVIVVYCSSTLQNYVLFILKCVDFPPPPPYRGTYIVVGLQDITI